MINILVTGGCGFIGSHFVEELLKSSNIGCIVNIDKMTYAANKTLPFQSNEHYFYHKMNINSSCILEILKEKNINYIVHFAAESHVDNSIADSDPFIKTNINGTHSLLKTSLNYINKGGNLIKFIHVSTDEVYGSLNFDDIPFTVNSPYRPNSPYAASKAASDLLVRSYVHTHKFPAIITNCSNNFGPRQFSEKLIPLCIKKLKNKQSIPLYGNGKNIRDWIYVKDHVNALIQVLLNGKVGSQYLIGGDKEISNYELVHILGYEYTNLTFTNIDWPLFNFVEDRKGHDLRYAIDTVEFKKEFPDWKLSCFYDSIKNTVKSYI
jgi:dTDP-glucose 4,6-dehydratase